MRVINEVSNNRFYKPLGFVFKEAYSVLYLQFIGIELNGVVHLVAI